MNFERNVGVTGWRMDVAPRVGLRLVGARILRAAVRWLPLHAVFAREQRRRAPTIRPRARCRSRSLDAGLVFERTARLARPAPRMTLEPRALYLYAPFREQSESAAVRHRVARPRTWCSSFRANRYVGADRVNDANQVSFGLTCRLFNADTGAQYLAASFGQAYYFEKPRVVLPDEAGGDARHVGLHRAGFAVRLQELERRKPACNGIPKTRAASARSSGLQYRPAAIAC